MQTRPPCTYGHACATQFLALDVPEHWDFTVRFQLFVIPFQALAVVRLALRWYM